MESAHRPGAEAVDYGRLGLKVANHIYKNERSHCRNLERPPGYGLFRQGQPTTGNLHAPISS